MRSCLSNQTKEMLQIVPGLENGEILAYSFMEQNPLGADDRFVSMKCSWLLSKDFKIVYCTSVI